MRTLWIKVKKGESTTLSEATFTVCTEGENSLILFYLFEPEQNVRNRAVPYIQDIQPGEKVKGDFSLCFFKK